MELQIRELRKHDHDAVIQYAIEGMHFNAYLDNKLILNLYGRYFWYLELTNATQVIAAYMGDELAGVLVVDMDGEAKPYASMWKRLYVKVFDLLQHAFYKGGVEPYDKANEAMLAVYRKEHHPDGQIRFLAANPHLKAKGIGTFLLNELARRVRGKELYLFTDSQCSYQFYEHRGFTRGGERDIDMDMKTKDVPLTCMLFSRQF
ncbi:GNAT family N-acetyltransferase [Bifidobacterium choloepi]|uniref:GNAT family N-acetyltransferase n=1 Tax=Bifidobacterium choloepi TaxID=2614131 RepID=A0A6I5NGQ6_9BIFI|nr:GNAT family N-acetyltransferase [Bifidobacterium choloepi]NEG70454.1 GNAT family N-acetyltransferase [Bifidobacterium choloepi]